MVTSKLQPILFACIISNKQAKSGKVIFVEYYYCKVLNGCKKCHCLIELDLQQDHRRTLVINYTQIVSKIYKHCLEERRIYYLFDEKMNKKRTKNEQKMNKKMIICRNVKNGSINKRTFLLDYLGQSCTSIFSNK